MLKRLKLLSLLSCIVLLSSCSWWQVYRSTELAVQNWPSDNFLEELTEEEIEEYFDLEEGSVDLSPFSPEE